MIYLLNSLEGYDYEGILKNVHKFVEFFYYLKVGERFHHRIVKADLQDNGADSGVFTLYNIELILNGYIEKNVEIALINNIEIVFMVRL